MNAFDDATAFYASRYDLIARWELEPGKKEQILGLGAPQVCRFCHQQSPDVSFKLVAHALPESLGNKSLFSAYECDGCNQRFGRGIEDDFGKWSMPMRTFARIRGKKGVPTLTKGPGGWRIAYGVSGFDIKAYEDDPVFDLDEEAKQLTLHLKRDTYTPLGVLKAFIKMGLTLMPANEMANFETAIIWINQDNHEIGPAEFPIIYTFIPGPMPNDLIFIHLLRRKHAVMQIPYAFFILGYGNEAFQVALPSPEQDAAIMGRNLEFPCYPTPTAPEEFGPTIRRKLNSTGRKPVKGEKFSLALGFQEVQKSLST